MVVLGLMVSHDHNFQYFPPNLGIGAAAKLLQSCPTLCDPIDTTHQAPPSLGFSRPEHWSGLSFPSPMHESEKWKRSRSVMSDPQQPHGLQPSRLPHPWDFPGKSTGVGCHCLLQVTPEQSVDTQSDSEFYYKGLRIALQIPDLVLVDQLSITQCSPNT